MVEISTDDDDGISCFVKGNTVTKKLLYHICKELKILMRNELIHWFTETSQLPEIKNEK
jgi:hypothetical protein